MLIISGEDALSDFRKRKYLSNLTAEFPQCENIEVTFVYFLDVDGDLDEKQLEKAHNLLNTSRRNQNQIPSSNSELRQIVVPRIGTISPWSTNHNKVEPRQIRMARRRYGFYTDRSKMQGH